MDVFRPFIVSLDMLSLLRRLSAPCLLLCVLAVPAAAETSDGPARLVADLAPESETVPLNGWSLASVGNRAVFVHTDNEYAPALWVTDGTAEGTSELAVLCPPCGSPVLLGSTGSVAFYQVNGNGNGPNHETQIWRTDGTKAGTFPVMIGSTNLIPGSLNGGRLFFTACTPAQGCELWSSDGTVAGTGLTGEIVPGPGSADIRWIVAGGDQAFVMAGSALWSAGPSGVKLLTTASKIRSLAADRGRAFFVAEDGAQGFEVWTSDGTAAGTRPVTSFGPKSPFGRFPFTTLVEGRFYFSARQSKGNDLWSVGATPGSLRRLTNLHDPNAYYSSVRKAGSRILFLAQLQEGSQFTPPRLWTSRGDFRTAAPVAGCPGGCPDVEGALAPLGQGRFAFHSHTQADSLWVTDGTGPGTRRLQLTGPYHDLSQFVLLGDHVLFELTNEYEIGDLWLTDGTPAGTFFLSQGGPSWSHYYGWAGSLIAGRANGRFLFGALLDSETNLHGALLSSSGSPGEMRELGRMEMGKSSDPQQLVPLRDRLLVQTCTGTALELHAVRGTETELLISQPYESCGGSTLSYRHAALDDRAVFVTFSSTEGSELWGTDGTRAGTNVLIPAALENAPMEVARFGNRFAIWVTVPASAGEFGQQLWVSDGTPAGTAKLLDLPAGMEMYRLTGIGGKLYFYDVVPDGGNSWSMQAWVTDGTAAGTRQLTSLSANTPDVVFTEAAGRVFFRLTPKGGTTEIWTTDGTPAGTHPAVTAASGMLDPKILSGAGGRLYFAARRANDPQGPLRPWVSDGTDAGTVQLADVAIEEGELDYYFAPGEQPGFTEAGGRVYFGGSDKTHGDELWSTDGTPEGTALVKDIAPGLLGSYPRSFAARHGRLYFRARDSGGMAHGMELWTSDGTAEGTQLLQDIAPGPSWSNPRELVVTGGDLDIYFTAHDGEHGREVWELPDEP